MVPGPTTFPLSASTLGGRDRISRSAFAGSRSVPDMRDRKLVLGVLLNLPGRRISCTL